MTKPFEQLPDANAVKIRAYGETKEELFLHAMRGMFESIQAIVNEKKPKTTRLLVSEGANIEDLFKNFLSDCLYLSETNHEIYRDANFLEFSDTHLHISLVGSPVSETKGPKIKALENTKIHIKKEKKIMSALFSLEI